jgi:hypothetical protein
MTDFTFRKKTETCTQLPSGLSPSVHMNDEVTTGGQSASLSWCRGSHLEPMNRVLFSVWQLRVY